MKKSFPKISVIIAVLNDKAGLTKTLDSYISQTYSQKELIIIDGYSTDGTLQLLKKYKKRLFKLIRLPPKGISNAFNKGVTAASGDYIYFLGAGDTLCNSHVLDNIIKDANIYQDLLISGQINRVNKDGNVLYTTQNIFKKWQLLYKMAVPHQGLFTHKKFFAKYGLFDENCKYAMDYDLLLRAYQDFPNLIQKDIVVANWVEGGIGQDNTDKVLAEYHHIRLKNKIAPVWFLNIIYLMSKLRYGQYPKTFLDR